MTTIGHDDAAEFQDWMNEVSAADRKPAPRLVLPGSAPEADWLAARRKGITASEISVVMGLSSFSSPYKLYWQKTGDLPADDPDDRMALGQHLEPYIAGRFTERRPEFSVAGTGRELYAHPDRPWQMATPDRLVCEGHPMDPASAEAVLECKSWGTYDGWGDDGSDEIPVHIRCQVLWQMDVMDVTTGYVACVFLPGAQLRVYELTMNSQAEDDLDVMRDEADLFLARLSNDIPPPIDWRPATTDALKALHPSVEDRDVNIGGQLARWYRAASRDVKAAEQRKAKYENQIRELLGSGRRATAASEVIVRRDVYDVAAKTIERKAFTVDKLVAVKPKEPTP